jgi:hypothetical protein
MSEERKQYGSKTHFFWNGELHKKLRVNRPANLLYAWNFVTRQRVTIIYSEWKKRKGVALSNNEVCELIGRHKTNVFIYIRRGDIPEPFSVGERRNDILNKARYYWSEEDLMGLQEYLSSRVGKVAMPHNIPTKAELRAKLNNDEILYVRSKDGKYIPTWAGADH